MSHIAKLLTKSQNLRMRRDLKRHPGQHIKSRILLLHCKWQVVILSLLEGLQSEVIHSTLEMGLNVKYFFLTPGLNLPLFTSYPLFVPHFALWAQKIKSNSSCT